MVITFNSIVILLQMEGQIETVECIALRYPTRCALLMCTAHCSRSCVCFVHTAK